MRRFTACCSRRWRQFPRNKPAASKFSPFSASETRYDFATRGRDHHVLGFTRRVREYDPYKLASPQVYLWRMTIFLIIAAFVALILYRQIVGAFAANPGLNSVIIAVLAIGIALSYRQIFRLFPEIRWVNTFRIAEPGVEADRAPVLLAPMATLLGDRMGGMGIAFSSSLFGLSGSLILGFLDLQAGQGQNMFYNDLEDWLSTVTDLDPELLDQRGGGTTAEDLRVAIERLSRAIQDGKGETIVEPGSAGSTQRATTAMANLAEGIQGLVQHMRSEQQVVRGWVETQSEQQKEVHALLETIAKALQSPPQAAE